jgi:hypothetical protein
VLDRGQGKIEENWKTIKDSLFQIHEDKDNLIFNMLAVETNLGQVKLVKKSTCVGQLTSLTQKIVWICNLVHNNNSTKCRKVWTEIGRRCEWSFPSLPRRTPILHSIHSELIVSRSEAK